jgi:hypothetical protein
MQNFNTMAYQPQFRPQMSFYKALPVTSEAEMNTYTVDFNGMPTYFHNQATNEIFVRKFDFRTGLTTTQKFVKSEPSSKPNLESKEENNIDLYKEELNAIYGKIDGLQEAIKNISRNNDIKGVKNAK